MDRQVFLGRESFRAR